MAGFVGEGAGVDVAAVDDVLVEVLPDAFDEGPAVPELDDEQALTSRPAVTTTETAVSPERRRFGMNTGPTLGDAR